jgi:hypothetical protein
MTLNLNVFQILAQLKKQSQAKYENVSDFIFRLLGDIPKIIGDSISRQRSEAFKRVLFYAP